MISDGFTETQIKNAMETRMKAKEGVNNVKDLESRYLPPEQDAEYARVIREIAAEELRKQAAK